ncbi:hypothetical protein KUH32_06655 [Thalassococcus sp. CAU 1522]|uniref:Glycerophosphoryl diester phosphodiesterase membrane domain-containing protein n=1 Tax=Thalassococcus arenae TaxID=2851652 RepID=A0ABS6N703_9RHOB|nr:hypothetical protein [Thalassococcus arenae]MBV2359447.1 hypothetical protein [Thalassococcus arenae]
MKGWQIFVHSVRLVLNNLGDALRVSAVLYAVQAAVQIVLFLNPPGVMEMDVVANGEPMQMMDPGDALRVLALQIVGIVASLWIAVAWHRYVLAGEYPKGWLPAWPGSKLAGYLGRSIMIGLLIALGVAILSIPVGFLAVLVPGLGVLTISALIGFGAFLFFKMGPILPAVALGEPIRLSEAWNATRGQDSAILTLALIVIAGSLLVQAPTLLAGTGTPFITLVYTLVTGWFLTLIGASMLTTLYGHFVQGRPID